MKRPALAALPDPYGQLDSQHNYAQLKRPRTALNQLGGGNHASLAA